MGKPAPVFDVDLLDENGESCAPGKVGEIVLRTGKTNPPGMFMGYYHDDELTDVRYGTTAYTIPATWRGATSGATIGTWAARTTL